MEPGSSSQTTQPEPAVGCDAAADWGGCHSIVGTLAPATSSSVVEGLCPSDHRPRLSLWARLRLP